MSVEICHILIFSFQRQNLVSSDDKVLQLSTKIRLYQALVMSVLLYAAETLTLLLCDEKTLEAFHLKYLCQILNIHWSQHVTNAEVSARTGLPPVMDFIRRRRLSVFGHIARLTQGTPAHNALHCQVGLASGRSLGGDWRRCPGRPRARWTD